VKKLLVVAACLLVLPLGAQTGLPTRLSDEDFWKLSQDSSEPGGYFRQADITNFTSNELGMQYVIPDLVSRVKPGRVYLGVGPEQNFTYISATKPAMVVIFDIRRGNLDMQLMYKAIFEMAADRADFVSMLFARPRPAGLTAKSTAAQIFSAFGAVRSDEALFKKTLAAIRERLTKTHGFALLPSDLNGIDVIYGTFYSNGFYLRPSPSYAELMTATDLNGTPLSFLQDDEKFAVMKDLEVKNLVVPVVGDFAGPKALRAIGQYLKARGGVVGAFYLSNVEQYLTGGLWDSFCRNVATMPLDAGSTFIRSQSGGGFGRGGGFVNFLGPMAEETRSCR